MGEVLANAGLLFYDLVGMGVHGRRFCVVSVVLEDVRHNGVTRLKNVCRTALYVECAFPDFWSELDEVAVLQEWMTERECTALTEVFVLTAIGQFAEVDGCLGGDRRPTVDR